MNSGPEPGLRYGSPDQAGLSASRLDRAAKLAAGWVEDGTHPALEVLVARRGVIALHETFGKHGSAPGARPFERGGLMQTASMIKPVTAAALMALVEDGAVGLTRPVQHYIPEFTGAGREAVYVHHLLTHTSGLYEDILVTVGQMFERLGGPRRFDGVHTVVDAFLQLACEHPLVGEPGRQMRYDTLNYELAGEIVRRVSGRPLQEFATERVLEPLGMGDTWYALPAEQQDRVVTADLGPSSLASATPLVGIAGASGPGVYSTALDMARFSQMFLEGGRGPKGQVLHPTSIIAMSLNQIPGTPGGFPQEWHDEASWSFGWGIACHEKWGGFPVFPAGTLNHAGGAGTIMWADPAHQLVGVYMSIATMVDASEPDSDEPQKGLAKGLALNWNADLFVNAVYAAAED